MTNPFVVSDGVWYENELWTVIQTYNHTCLIADVDNVIQIWVDSSDLEEFEGDEDDE